MSGSLLWGTGFESGSLTPPNTIATGRVTSPVHTGIYAYATQANSSYPTYFYSPQFSVVAPDIQDEIYLSQWSYKNGTGMSPWVFTIYFFLNDSTYFGVNFSQSNVVLLNNGANVGTASAYINDQTWALLEFHLYVHNTSGSAELKINGTEYITYYGDTQPSTGSNIAYCRTGGDNTPYIVDDFSVGVGGWLNDVRYEVMYPAHPDLVAEWDILSGSDSYAMVDDIPPDDATYISASLNNLRVMMKTGSWSGCPLITPVGAMVWYRSKNDLVDGSGYTPLISDGSSVLVGVSASSTGNFEQSGSMFALAPDGGAWDLNKINNLYVGASAVII